MYTQRIAYVVALVKLGRDVLISDIDALWLQDPLPDLVSTNAGVVGSFGLSPPLAVAEWGAGFCMGFIFFRGSDTKVRAGVTPLTTPMREDQKSFNANIRRERLVWDDASMLQSETRFGTVLAHDGNASYAGLRVAMLPRSRYIRWCSSQTNFSAVVIAHCYVGAKERRNKERELSKLHLWFIPRRDSDLTDDPNPPMPQPGSNSWRAFLALSRRKRAAGLPPDK